MPPLLSSDINFSLLSLKDLLEARDLFHVHLINKANVVATAIGKYLIRFEDIDPKTMKHLPEEKRKPKKDRSARTLFNSTVIDESWPCILVFVKTWIYEYQLAEKFSDDLSQIIPRQIYMPDGRIVPICPVLVSVNPESDAAIDETTLIFPSSYVGGGFPLKLFSQGVERIASVGCIVHDGHKYYALTNKHVVGDPGTIIHTEMGGQLVPIGKTASLQLSTLTFSTAYKDWPGQNIILNTDVGLIELDDIRQWKADILGIGVLGEMADLNIHNMSLSLIGTQVSAHGAVSGDLKGEIKSLFYRYKSVGGYEYIADYMIGPRITPNLKSIPLTTRQGDSGTLWVIDEVHFSKTNIEKNLPLALQWGQQRFLNDKTTMTSNFSLATGLSNISRVLEVDVVRDWNLDNDYSWGKLGHWKIAAYSCDLVRDTKLSKLLAANKKHIGYEDDSFIDQTTLSGKFTDKFVPLGDVADIYWRSKRPNDKNNHFADMDESFPDVENGKTLLDLCKKDTNIDVDVWLRVYGQMDQLHPLKGKRLGALPFRVWQMYLQMIRSLKAGKLDEFITAGGTMSHYVGDASQTLHISFLHHGEDEGEGGVHTDYENTMLERNVTELLQLVNSHNKKVLAADLIGPGGRDAAKRVIELMRFTHKNLPPEKVLDVWRKNKGAGKIKNMWAALKDKTSENIAEGSRVMAILWDSAWKHGNGKAIAQTKLKDLGEAPLKKLYQDKTFVPSLFMNNKGFKDLLRP